MLGSKTRPRDSAPGPGRVHLAPPLSPSLPPVAEPDPDAEDQPEIRERPLQRGVPVTAFFTGQTFRHRNRCEEGRAWLPSASASATASRLRAVGRRWSFLRDRVSSASFTPLRARRKDDAGGPKALQKAGAGYRGRDCGPRQRQRPRQLPDPS